MSEIFYFMIDHAGTNYREQKYTAFVRSENNYCLRIALLSPAYYGLPGIHQILPGEGGRFIDHIRKASALRDQHEDFPYSSFKYGIRKIITRNIGKSNRDMKTAGNILYDVNISLDELKNAKNVNQLETVVSDFIPRARKGSDKTASRTREYNFEDFGIIKERFPGYYNSPEGQSFIHCHRLYLQFYQRKMLRDQYYNNHNFSEVDSVGSYFVWSAGLMASVAAVEYGRKNNLPLITYVRRYDTKGAILSLVDKYHENAFTTCPITSLSTPASYFNACQILHHATTGEPLLDNVGTGMVLDYINEVYQQEQAAIKNGIPFDKPAPAG